MFTVQVVINYPTPVSL